MTLCSVRLSAAKDQLDPDLSPPNCIQGPPPRAADLCDKYSESLSTTGREAEVEYDRRWYQSHRRALIRHAHANVVGVQRVIYHLHGERIRPELESIAGRIDTGDGAQGHCRSSVT